MDQIITSLKTQTKRPGTIQLVAIGTTLIVIGLIMGISDNLPGIIVMGVGVGFIFFSLIHHWREPGQFGTLFAVSIISFPVLVLLHNIFDGVNQNIGNIPVVNQLLEGLAVISFFAAILFAPVATLIGIFAGLFYLIKSKLK